MEQWAFLADGAHVRVAEYYECPSGLDHIVPAQPNALILIAWQDLTMSMFVPECPMTLPLTEFLSANDWPGTEVELHHTACWLISNDVLDEREFVSFSYKV